MVKAFKSRPWREVKEDSLAESIVLSLLPTLFLTYKYIIYNSQDFIQSKSDSVSLESWVQKFFENFWMIFLSDIFKV